MVKMSFFVFPLMYTSLCFRLIGPVDQPRPCSSSQVYVPDPLYNRAQSTQYIPLPSAHQQSYVFFLLLRLAPSTCALSS